MLPGGLSVLGVFYISDAEAKDTLITLRQVRHTHSRTHTQTPTQYIMT